MQTTPRKTEKGVFLSIDEGESINDGKRALFYLEEEDREGGKKKDIREYEWGIIGGGEEKKFAGEMKV